MSLITTDKHRNYPIEELKVIPPNKEYEGWYCVNIFPGTCKCGVVVSFVDCGPHFVVVWEDLYDDVLLNVLTKLQSLDLEPEVRKYHSIYGDCISFDQGVELGWISQPY